jgi:glycosyltransferase involved in cell wall biosynthesis
MRVCFFGAYDPAYPRNRILRAGLALHGAEVLEARVVERRAWRRWPALAAAFGRSGARSDVVLVPEFRHKDVPLARALCGRRRLVFDPLVSRYDTLVGDWQLHADDSGQAAWNRGIDRWSFRLADLVLCDTWAHGALFESLGARRGSLRRVVVGAEDAFFAVPAPPPAPPVRIVYVGGFLPLHGVGVMLDALAWLERERRELPGFEATFAGRGIEFEDARRRAGELGLGRAGFPGPIAYGDLPGWLASAHIVLGAFDEGEKAGRVIPHKVYQGLAAGRAVVTGDGDGLRELFTPGRDLLAVPRGDAGALAEALERVIRDEALRAALGAAGRSRALEVGTPERVGASLLAALEAG